LQDARASIVPTGVLVLLVASVQGLPARLIGRRLANISSPHVLTHFTASGLRQLLERTGFVQEPGPRLLPPLISAPIFDVQPARGRASVAPTTWSRLSRRWLHSEIEAFASPLLRATEPDTSNPRT
jgi:hypothetical protein